MQRAQRKEILLLTLRSQRPLAVKKDFNAKRVVAQSLTRQNSDVNLA